MNKLVEIEEQYKAGRFSKKAYINLMHKCHLVLWEYLELIKDKNIASIEINQRQIILKTKDGIRLICDPLDKRHILKEILNFGDYEPTELQMIKRFLKKDSVVLDIGANIGWYSINLSKSVPGGRIISFEPIPKTYEYLIKNIALNQLRNIKTYNIGLSNKAGCFNFYYNRNYTSATSLVNIIKDDNVAIVKCRVEKLDDFLKKAKIMQVDFIKCDVEGAEKFVIEGGQEVINKNKPIIFIELLRKWSAKFNYHPNSIINILKDIGYGCYIIKKTKLKRIKKITEITQYTNFCFLHKIKHSKLLIRLI
ncbi:MAG: FkbM family methyltransferase [Candidatus Omnitrophota bacterium]|nr:FkbM family methyltransferase [Candidatus Omnitrophota bacterium]